MTTFPAFSENFKQFRRLYMILKDIEELNL